MRYRPWGSIAWTLTLSEKKNWHFVGAIGTEYRSLCSWSYLRHLRVLSSEQLIQIQDIDSDKYRVRTHAAIQLRRGEFVQQGGRLDAIEEMELMAELFMVSSIARKAELASDSVVLDITSFPKRYFFPILRALVLSKVIKNVLLTYTSPESYASDAPLYEDIEPWRVLPGFGGGATKNEMWIVSVGFLVESLRLHVECNPNKKMNILIPFPAPLAVLRRTWESVANLEREQSIGRFEKIRVETLDMSSAFDRIISLAGKPAQPVAFAPFGPKPTSAAMCLYAIQMDSSVHYPQPTVYHPEYSKGVRNSDPERAVSAYWIKHEGENLYSV